MIFTATNEFRKRLLILIFIICNLNPIKRISTHHEINRIDIIHQHNRLTTKYFAVVQLISNKVIARFIFLQEFNTDCRKGVFTHSKLNSSLPFSAFVNWNWATSSDKKKPELDTTTQIVAKTKPLLSLNIFVTVRYKITNWTEPILSFVYVMPM